MADLNATMRVQRMRAALRPAGYGLEMVRTGAERVARISRGLWRCRIVAVELVERLGGRGRQLWGAPLGTATYGERTVGGPPVVRTLGITTLGGRIRGHSIR